MDITGPEMPERQSDPHIESVWRPAKKLSIPIEKEPNTVIFIGAEDREVKVRLLSGNGVFSNVYVGGYEGGEPDSLVVKKAKEWETYFDFIEEKTRSRTKEVFDQEVTALRDLERFGSKHTPRVHFYHEGSGPDNLPYIVMDFARGIRLHKIHFTDEMDKIFYYSKDRTLWERPGETPEGNKERLGIGTPEEIALEITSQFAETEAIAQQAGYFNPDIKELNWGGLIWDPEEHHLTVIDWNTIWEANEKTKERTIERTGSLLYYLLIGKILSYSQPLESQHGWKILKKIASPEIQGILSKCLTPQRDQRYQNINDLSADLTRALKTANEQRVST